jgi:hypothetical protein
MEKWRDDGLPTKPARCIVIEMTFYDAKCMQVIDHFGNRIRLIATLT